MPHLNKSIEINATGSGPGSGPPRRPWRAARWPPLYCSTSATCLSKIASSSATNCTEKDQSMLQRNQLQCIKRPVVTLDIELSFEKDLIYAHLLIQSSDISLISKDYGHFLTFRLKQLLRDRCVNWQEYGASTHSFHGALVIERHDFRLHNRMINSTVSKFKLKNIRLS